MFVDTPAMRACWLYEYEREMYVPSKGQRKKCYQYIKEVAYAWGRMRGASDWFVEEALQETWVTSWFKFYKFLWPRAHRASFSTWVLTIFENNLKSMLSRRSKHYIVLPEADIYEYKEGVRLGIEGISDRYQAHYDTEERQPDDVSVLDLLDSDVKKAALKVLRETGDLARGWQSKVAVELGLSRMAITYRLQGFREAAASGTII